MLVSRDATDALASGSRSAPVVNVVCATSAAAVGAGLLTVSPGSITTSLAPVGRAPPGLRSATWISSTRPTTHGSVPSRSSRTSSAVSSAPAEASSVSTSTCCHSDHDSCVRARTSTSVPAVPLPASQVTPRRANPELVALAVNNDSSGAAGSLEGPVASPPGSVSAVASCGSSGGSDSSAANGAGPSSTTSAAASSPRTTSFTSGSTGSTTEPTAAPTGEAPSPVATAGELALAAVGTRGTTRRSASPAASRALVRRTDFMAYPSRSDVVPASRPVGSRAFRHGSASIAPAHRTGRRRGETTDARGGRGASGSCLTPHVLPGRVSLRARRSVPSPPTGGPLPRPGGCAALLPW